MNVRNRATAAITAVAMAKPLVRALVVLPGGVQVGDDLDRPSHGGARAVVVRVRSLSAPDISKMPLALSEIGPNVSIAST